MPTQAGLDPDHVDDPLLPRIATLRTAREHALAEQLLRDALAQPGARDRRAILRLELALAEVLEDRQAWSEAEAVYRKALADRAGLDRDHSEIVQLQSALDLLLVARDDGEDRTVIKDAAPPPGSKTPVVAPGRAAGPSMAPSPLTLPRRVSIPIVLGGIAVGILVSVWWFFD